ncbi:MAG: sulfatase-like hydrolase/transferase [Verrucomicrobiota bacterium]|nr:sulfatase-like hydrolase/transferase [Verrucomicrobiota bacterium]
MQEAGKKNFIVNYPYFFLFFVLLLLLSATSILLKESLHGSRTFFLLYAAGQTALETMLLALLCTIVSKYFNTSLSRFMVAITFLLLTIHGVDFFLDRLLDLTVWETLDAFVLHESFTHFAYLLDASGVPLWIWVLGGLFLLTLPFIGIALYNVLHLIAQEKPFFIGKEWALQTFVCILLSLFFWDITASRVIHPDSYTSFLKSLPWKWTFLRPETIHFPLGTALAPPPAPDISTSAHLKQRPNIYLFIIESLRADCITPHIAPHLFKFKEENNSFDLALSNGNGSHISWFSIFYSEYPFFWNMTHGNEGSPALRQLREWGYTIRLYSSADLGYYSMESILFGEGNRCLDSIQTFPHPPPQNAAKSDLAALEALQRDLRENPEMREGQCFLIFLDATHFPYAWAEDFSPPFTPYCPATGYFQLFQSSRSIEEIKNRYRNAISYVDSLFGQFVNSQDLGQSIIVVTGDHGEEFFEHGHLFHGSHLTHEQTNIPLYMKLGNRIAANPPSVVSQMDIFPTIFHYLSGEVPSYLQGHCILLPNPSPYALIARFHGGRSPIEFCLHNGESKLIAQFDNHREILDSPSLTIRSLRNRADLPLMEPIKDVQGWVQKEFGEALSRLLQEEQK